MTTSLKKSKPIQQKLERMLINDQELVIRGNPYTQGKKLHCNLARVKLASNLRAHEVKQPSVSRKLTHFLWAEEASKLFGCIITFHLGI